MNFLAAVQTGFSRYGSATGRASRSEYWYWTLFNVVVSVVTWGLDYVLFPLSTWGPIETLSGLVLLLPSWAVSIRRLHDINRSGYWLLIVFTLVGIPLVLYWACKKGTEGDNDYGADPLGAPSGAS
jgi:uncharacterized membrane protein YhaH (DUF805 family)